MELIGIIIISLVFVFAFTYILARTEDVEKGYNKKKIEQSKETREKEKKEEERKEEEINLNLLGEKMFDARDKLKRAKFHIDEEEISPIEQIGKNQYVRMVCIDSLAKKMAVISIVQSAKDPLINIYDIDNVVKCELEVNDKEIYDLSVEVGYELRSVKLNITRNDVINPDYSIGLLPKLVNNPNMAFRRDYFDFAKEIQKHILKLNKNTK